MIDFIRNRGRGGRFVALTVVAVMVVGVGLVATPSSANPPGTPPNNFLPDDDNTNSSFSNILSDRFDGSDSLAHLTNVATADTDRVDFYACPTSVGASLEQGELGSCDVFIGSDTTPNVPTGGTLLNPPDEAYEVFWDIPAPLDTLLRNIVALACVGAGTTIPPTANPNCRQDLEQNIRLDDAAGGTAGQSTSGEITQVCTADTDGPGVGADPCNIAGTLPNTAARALIDARFKPSLHGDPIPQTGVVFRGVTSPDVAIGDAKILLDYGADANNDPDTQDDTATGVLVEDKTTHRIWEFSFSSITLDDNVELAAVLEEQGNATPDDGTGFCDGDADGPGVAGNPPPGAVDCSLDAHYHASVARTPAKVVQSWTGNVGHTHLPPSPGATAGCEAGETPVKAHANEDLDPAVRETGEICVTDQFTDPLNGVNVLEEITSPGNITSGGAADHDGDGRFEHEDNGVTNAAGVEPFTVNNFNATVGTATLTSCVETEPLSTTTGHGCANEPLKDTLSIAFATLPTEVFLSYSGTGTGADPCRTGATIAQGTVGQRESLLVCTFDSEGNLISTEVDGSRLQWTIVGAHGNDAPSVGFVGAPPTETGGNGQSTLQIDDIGAGDNFIIVTLLNANGDGIDSFQIEKDVRGGPDDRCDKIKKKIKRIKKKIRKAKAALKKAKASGDDDRVSKLKKKLRRLKKRLRRLRNLKRQVC